MLLFYAFKVQYIRVPVLPDRYLSYILISERQLSPTIARKKDREVVCKFNFFLKCKNLASLYNGKKLEHNFKSEKKMS
jgi:hypothetical protein